MADRSLKQLVTDVRRNAALLAKQELALKKAELKEKATMLTPIPQVAPDSWLCVTVAVQ